MFLPMRDLDLLGVFLSPASGLLIASLVPSIVLHYLIASRDVDRFVSNRPLAEVVMFFIFFALAILTLRPG